MVQDKELQVEDSLWSVITLLQHLRLLYQHLLDEQDRNKIQLDRGEVESKLHALRSEEATIRQLLERTSVPALPMVDNSVNVYEQQNH